MAARLSGPIGDGAAGFRQNAEVNVTPFVDVMLVLLIILMVAAPLATTSIKLDLPPASAGDTRREPALVSVQKSSVIYIGAQRTTLASLPRDLARAIGGRAPTAERVFVRADGDVAYAGFMSVIDTLHEGGFKKLGLVGEDLPKSL